jgi:hypothetical protein
VQVDRAGREEVDRVLDRPAAGGVQQLRKLQGGREPADAERPAGAGLGLDQPWPHLGARERDRVPALDQDVEHHHPLVEGRLQLLGRRQLMGRVDEVPHEGGDRAVGEQGALDQRHPRAPPEVERLGDVAGHLRLLDGQVAGAEALALSPGEGCIGLEHFEPGAEGGGLSDPAHERAAALAADDLAVRLEPLQRQAQRAARDPQLLGQLLLGGKAVAGPGAAGREAVPERVLRDVYE